jgi:hypothetical protein
MMSESRSGLDIGEGSAKAGEEDKSQLVDTNAENAQNPVSEDQLVDKPADQSQQDAPAKTSSKSTSAKS